MTGLRATRAERELGSVRHVVLAVGLILLVNLAWLYARRDRAQGPRPGQPAIAFQLPVVPADSSAPPDEKAGLEREPGQPVLLVFFATWSPSSIDELPLVARLHARYAHRGLRVLAVSAEGPAAGPGADEARLRLLRYVRRARLPFPVLRDGAEVAERYGVMALPYRVLVDRDGVVRLTERGGVGAREPEALGPLLEKVLP